MTHPVDATITALLALWTDAPELDYTCDDVTFNLPIVDGQLLDDPDALRFVLVGTGGQYALPAATGQARVGFGGSSVERFTLTCEVHAWSGDTDLGAARGQAFATLTGLGELVARDRTLGGVVEQAAIATQQYRPAQSEDGVGVIVAFTVSVTARVIPD